MLSILILLMIVAILGLLCIYLFQKVKSPAGNA